MQPYQIMTGFFNIQNYDKILFSYSFRTGYLKTSADPEMRMINSRYSNTGEIVKECCHHRLVTVLFKVTTELEGKL